VHRVASKVVFITFWRQPGPKEEQQMVDWCYVNRWNRGKIDNLARIFSPNVRWEPVNYKEEICLIINEQAV